MDPFVGSEPLLKLRDCLLSPYGLGERPPLRYLDKLRSEFLARRSRSPAHPLRLPSLAGGVKLRERDLETERGEIVRRGGVLDLDGDRSLRDTERRPLDRERPRSGDLDTILGSRGTHYLHCRIRGGGGVVWWYAH